MSIRLRLTIYWSAITALILFAAGLLIIALFSRAMWGALDAALMEEADTDRGRHLPFRRRRCQSDSSASARKQIWDRDAGCD